MLNWGFQKRKCVDTLYKSYNYYINNQLNLNEMITEHKKGVIDFIRIVFMKEMSDLVYYPGGAYSKFMILIQGIEFLGACQDKEPFDSEIPGLSKIRFNNGMSLFGKKYMKFIGKKAEVNFYKDFRCPMIHQFKHNQKKITLATKKGVNNQDVHLKKNENGQLYIVLEDFYTDIFEAASKLIEKVESGKYSVEKLSEPYLTIHSIEELQYETT